MKKGPFEVKSTKIVYQNPWLKVREDSVIRPNGEKGIFGVIEVGEGITVVALNDKHEVYLTQEFKYANNTNNWEVPSGGLEKGETPLEAAKRELEEEVGLIAKKWTPLGKYHPLTMILKAPSYFFLAEDLEEGQRGQEEKELIQIEKVPLEKAVAMAVNGDINHSGSIIALLLTARLKNI